MSNTVDPTDGVRDQVEIGFGFKTHEAALGSREVTASPSPPEVSRGRDTWISVGLYRAPKHEDTGATFTTLFRTPFGTDRTMRCFGVIRVIDFLEKECANVGRCALIGYDAEGFDAPLLFRFLDECRIALPANVDVVDVPRKHGGRCDPDTGRPDEEQSKVVTEGAGTLGSPPDDRRRFGSDSVASAINGMKREYGRTTSETGGIEKNVEKFEAVARSSERPLERPTGALVKAIFAHCAYRQMMKS